MTRDLLAECYCSDAMDTIYVPPHRASTERGAHRQAVRFLRDAGSFTAADYNYITPPRIRKVWAITREDANGEIRLFTYVPEDWQVWERPRAVTYADDGAKEWWEVSW